MKYWFDISLLFASQLLTFNLFVLKYIGHYLSFDFFGINLALRNRRRRFRLSAFSFEYYNGDCTTLRIEIMGFHQTFVLKGYPDELPF